MYTFVTPLLSPSLSDGKTRVDVMRPATDLVGNFCKTDSQYVRCSEKFEYERRFGDIFRWLGGSAFLGCPTDPGKVIRLSRPQDQINFFSNLSFWSCGIDFTCCM